MSSDRSMHVGHSTMNQGDSNVYININCAAVLIQPANLRSQSPPRPADYVPSYDIEPTRSTSLPNRPVMDLRDQSPPRQVEYVPSYDIGRPATSSSEQQQSSYVYVPEVINKCPYCDHPPFETAQELAVHIGTQTTNGCYERMRAMYMDLRDQSPPRQVEYVPSYDIEPTPRATSSSEQQQPISYVYVPEVINKCPYCDHPPFETAQELAVHIGTQTTNGCYERMRASSRYD